MCAANVDQADAAIVLCAGASIRMGQPKGALDLDGVPLLSRHLTALSPFSRRLVVVLGAHEHLLRAIVPADVLVVQNAEWHSNHPADSLRLALLVLESVDRVFVTPVDTPPASPALLRLLLAGSAPAVPDFGGQTGHPVLLDAPCAHAVRAEAPEGGLRTLLHSARRVPVDDPWVCRDFDTPSAWARWLRARQTG